MALIFYPNHALLILLLICAEKQLDPIYPTKASPVPIDTVIWSEAYLKPSQTPKMDFKKICTTDVWKGPKHTCDGAGKKLANELVGFEFAFQKF